MQKLQMMSKDRIQANVEKIQQLFPSAVTEVVRNGKTTLAVDFDVLKQEMSDTLINDKEQRYHFTWPGKFQAMQFVNRRLNSTLRPCKEESVDFDNTENLYIEGDNLDVLKLLQENYLGKIKMIYIDPPYNTGNDFVYKDNFAMDTDEYLENSDQFDDEGNRLVQNTESNGRFHTDWLNMIYPRLKVARDLLSEYGVIFISIDDNEQENLKKVCDEIFGGENFEGILVWKTKTAAKGVPTCNMLVKNHDYILVYSKNKRFRFKGENRDLSKFSNPDCDPRGPWKADNMKSTVSQKSFSICDPNTGNVFTKTWAFSEETLQKMIQEDKIIWPSDASGTPRQKRFLFEMSNETTPIRTLIGEFQSETATNKLKELFNNKKLFDFPKPTELLKLLVQQSANSNDTILDFFSGSATTAHAVMQLNAEDGGNRKFIMVQLPEVCDEKSEAFKAGYKNICEIGKERIRRAGKKILEEQAHLVNAAQSGALAKGEAVAEFPTSQSAQATQEQIKSKLDVGFRVLKLDSSNMKEVYYRSQDYQQDMLDDVTDNVKEDRTPLDLLFQVMLELGTPLSAKIEEREICGKRVFFVDGNSLVACFDSNVSDEVVKAIAKTKPSYAVLRDSSLANDSVATNFEQIFATYSPNTTRRVI